MKILMMAAMVFAGAIGYAEIGIDFTVTTGPVKPVNGVGQPPMNGMPMRPSMTHYLKEAGIPYSRLHDVGGAYGQNRYVDISNIFPNFDADENDPKNYYFQYTDHLINELVKQGVEPFFRLGETIQNSWEWGDKIEYKEEWRVKPPKDFAKWARIAEHIIRHYTEGWANGFRHKIAYWEIWNEPDNRENPEMSPLWRAPFGEYIRFYGVVAPYLKAKFPHLKIGGFGCCGFYDAVGASAVGAAHSSPRTRHFIDCAHKFLKAAKDNQWPLDFFSFHSYSDTPDALKQVAFADKLLSDYGFTSGSPEGCPTDGSSGGADLRAARRTERVFNEWLPAPAHESLGTALQASHVAAELIGLQNGPCDVACIYDGRCGPGDYSPLFNPMTYKPHKAYYGFVAFNELRKLGTAVKAVPDDPSVSVAAAAKGDEAAVMIVNPTGETKPLELALPGWHVTECRVTSRRVTDSLSRLPKTLPPESVVLVKARKGEPPPKRDVSWMRGSFGVSVHWTAQIPCEDGTRLDFEEAVNAFDVDRFVADLGRLGAKHLIFTTAHGEQRLPCPNAALDAIAPGRTTKRDLFGEILDRCNEKGIRVIAYYNHSCNGWTPDVVRWMKECDCPFGPERGGDESRFHANVISIVRDMSLRYGRRLSGWWFDSTYSVDTRGRFTAVGNTWCVTPPDAVYRGEEHHFPWEELADAARAGNPDAAVAVNAGVGVPSDLCVSADYYSGESENFDDVFEEMPDPSLVDSRWICIDDRNWTFSEKRGFTPLRLPLPEIRKYVETHVAAGRMVTFNVLIDQRGRLNPAVFALEPFRGAVD